MIIVNGSVVINVIVCNDSSPPKLSNIRDSAPISAPQKILCHKGVFLLLLKKSGDISYFEEDANLT